jgi:CRISPR-associated protein Cas1
MSSVDDFIGAERVLTVSSRSHISFSGDRIIVEQRDAGTRTELPVGDVLAFVLESEQATVTAATLAACGENGVPVIFCRRHLPASIALPLDASWNGGEIRRKQAWALRGEAAARRLWRRTIRAKIFAQAAVVKSLNGRSVARLRRLADTVALDGVETVEAQAAALYWRSLFEKYERRDFDDPRNGMLNWGYAVLLATIGRALVSLGLDPALGFGHAGQTNAWALACDLMEPYRPSIDLVVALSAQDDLFGQMTMVKARLLRLFANDGPAKRAILDTVRGYREFLDDGNETRVQYPDGPLVA